VLEVEAVRMWVDWLTGEVCKWANVDICSFHNPQKLQKRNDVEPVVCE